MLINFYVYFLPRIQNYNVAVKSKCTNLLQPKPWKKRNTGYIYFYRAKIKLRSGGVLKLSSLQNWFSSVIFLGCLVWIALLSPRRSIFIGLTFKLWMGHSRMCILFFSFEAILWFIYFCALDITPITLFSCNWWINGFTLSSKLTSGLVDGVMCQLSFHIALRVLSPKFTFSFICS